MPPGVPLPVAILAGLATGAACGLVNGVLISAGRLPPFIATLAMMAIARGLATVWTSGWYISGLPDAYLQIGQGTFLGVPYPVCFALLILVVYSFLLNRWKPLNQSYYVGHNPPAATLSGLRTTLVTFSGYAISGLLAGVAALFLTSRLAMGFFQFGLGSELNAIAAAVIGGASFAGGSGSLVGTFLGVLLIIRPGAEGFEPASLYAVVGVLEGAGPLANETVVIGAHYDHVGVDARGRIGHGADDNASGVANMLEIARLLSSRNWNQTIIFAALTAEGVTTIEIKSGYGLETEAEILMLEVAGDLDDRGDVVRTFLGAHEVPPEHRG